MKKAFLLMAGLLIMLNLVACSGLNENSEYFGFRKKDFTIVEEVDTHGGFHGDGSYYLILDCSENKDKALENLSDWTELPLSENLNLTCMVEEKDGRT